MARYGFGLAFILTCAALLAGCGGENPGGLNGRILVWHSRSGSEAAALERIFAKFSDIYPDVRIVSASVPADDLRQRYESSAALGVGPDLFIGPGEWIPSLVEANLIADIGEHPLDRDAYLANAIGNLDYQGGLYGLPFALRLMALYYNQELVKEPPKTLSDLLAQAEEGRGAAISTRFSQAFWGVQAFGGRLFDDGRVILDRGGFADWLSWLKTAQDAPGVFLNRDDATLRDLFLEERVAYYVAGPELLPVLLEDPDGMNAAVSPLPAGPEGPAGPFLRVDALMFNKASSKRQTEIALALAQFMTNAEQSAALVREIGLVPANRKVRVDRRIYPAVGGFVLQSYTAVAVPNTPQMDMVSSLGDSIYAQVLEGVVDPDQAAAEISRQVNEAFGVSGAAPLPVGLLSLQENAYAH